ncbi:MAG: hypothetical protein C0523_05445, partial [Cytophaga sp.]|nr:hypothetical protein [Cytophaga sp.]
KILVRQKMIISLMKFGLLLIMITCSWVICAQEIRFEEPAKLGSYINSDAEEINPLLSSDGKSLYFTRAFHEENTGGKIAGSDIWRSDKDEKGQWLPAINKFKTWNTKGSNTVIGMNKTNDIIYLLNSYSKKSGIAFSKLINGEWTSPEIISIPGMERSEFVGYYMNASFDVLIISMNTTGSFGEEDLYVSTKDSSGKWSTPANLGSTINTSGFEISPFLSADGKRLYFSSNGHKGKGDADIFYSDRLYNSWEAWSTPKNLGDKINSPKFDAYFSIYGDSVAFFSSNKNSELADIYKVKVVLAEDFDSEKKYLAREEVVQLIGNVSLDIKFDKNSSTLNSSQNELLFYIANKILTKTEIKFQLVLNEDTYQNLTQARLDAVSDKLKTLGISSYRIYSTRNKSAKASPIDEEVLKITLFR